MYQKVNQKTVGQSVIPSREFCPDSTSHRHGHDHAHLIGHHSNDLSILFHLLIQLPLQQCPLFPLVLSGCLKLIPQLFELVLKPAFAHRDIISTRRTYPRIIVQFN